MAEALARNLLPDWEVYSAGVSAFDGAPASVHAVTAMQEEGLDISAHASQMISPELINGAALVLTMTGRHLDVIKAACPSANAYTLRDFAAAGLADVSDPFGGDINIYRTTAAEIKQLITNSIEKIREGL